jgi:uncharacterized small protein (DUF1192 family)
MDTTPKVVEIVDQVVPTMAEAADYFDEERDGDFDDDVDDDDTISTLIFDSPPTSDDEDDDDDDDDYFDPDVVEARVGEIQQRIDLLRNEIAAIRQHNEEMRQQMQQ